MIHIIFTLIKSFNDPSSPKAAGLEETIAIRHAIISNAQQDVSDNRLHRHQPLICHQQGVLQASLQHTMTTAET